jgi:hypothetical protein
MAKNLSNLLQKGNLTPKERYLLIIQNDIEKATTGKEPLTKADVEALQNWQAKTSNEAREWNKYNEGWKLSGRAGIDAEFVYAETKAEHYRKNILTTELASYPVYRERLNALKTLKKIKIVDIKEAIEITNKQREQKLKNGIDFDYAIYQLAFESLSDEIRKDILILDEEAEYEPSYLNDEETIADLLNGKEELNKEAKEKYAELVADRSYNKFAKESKEYQLHGAFARLPIMDIAKKWAKDKGIKPRPKDYEGLEKTERLLRARGGLKASDMTEDKFYKALKEERGGDKEEWLLEENLKDILEDYARDNKTTIKKILKETLLKWLEDGLPYPPLIISEDKKTYSEDTKLPHNELFKEWLKAKDKARETLNILINKGGLKTADETGQGKTITGDSLYSLKSEFEFVKDFKERVDKYQANLGLVYADDDPEYTGDNLDRELLIAEKDKDGKPSIVSLFGMSIKKIEGQFNQHFFTETEKDGETYLEFKRDSIKEVFKTTRQGLIDGYAKLLAFQDMHKKLSKIYEIDLTFLITPKVKQVSEFIDQHNFYLDNALEDLAGFGVGFSLYKKPLKTRENFYIEREKIAPDINIVEEYGKKFYEILGDEYKF